MTYQWIRLLSSPSCLPGARLRVRYPRSALASLTAAITAPALAGRSVEGDPVAAGRLQEEADCPDPGSCRPRGGLHPCCRRCPHCPPRCIHSRRGPDCPLFAPNSRRPGAPLYRFDPASTRRGYPAPGSSATRAAADPSPTAPSPSCWSTVAASTRSAAPTSPESPGFQPSLGANLPAHVPPSWSAVGSRGGTPPPPATNVAIRP